MKFLSLIAISIVLDVAPYAGAWVEIGRVNFPGSLRLVAPYAGAWVEIVKFLGFHTALHVAPYTGAWVEIVVCVVIGPKKARRSLRGSVG